MAIVRVKYRPAAVQPEFGVAKTNTSLSVGKKVKPVEVDPYADLPKISNDPTIFLASHTQIKRIEVVVTSNEEEYRMVHHPTMEERVVKQKEWAITQGREAKIASEREALRQSYEKQALRARQLLTATLLNKKDGTPIDPALHEKITVDPNIPEELLGPGGKPLMGDGGGEAEGDDEDIMMNEDFAAELLDIKERKLLATRDMSKFHKHMTAWDLRKLSLRFQMGWVGSKDREYSVILPWLLIGRKEVANNQQLLNKLSITHILNVTRDQPNKFPSSYIYERVPIKDNENEDISEHWPTIINFIGRVEKAKGRVFVHCTVGSSRAPSAVLAYLVYNKGVPLIDAFRYVRTLRPVTLPNHRFLLELAKLEVGMGEGCSVLFDREWRFYEFNVFRGEGFGERKPVGTHRTLVLLHRELAVEELGEEEAETKTSFANRSTVNLSLAH